VICGSVEISRVGSSDAGFSWTDVRFGSLCRFAAKIKDLTTGFSHFPNFSRIEGLGNHERDQSKLENVRANNLGKPVGPR
jgi:hypothetical protein